MRHYPPVIRDPRLPHQIVLFFSGPGGSQIAVSCNCRRVLHSWAPLAMKPRWQPEEVLAVYRLHLPLLSLAEYTEQVRHYQASLLN